jgi:hypothetical protein
MTSQPRPSSLQSLVWHISFKLLPHGQSLETISGLFRGR